MRTCSAASVSPESRRGTCRTLQLRRARGAYHPCRPHAQKIGVARNRRAETRFAAAACARHRRQPERARHSLPVNDRELIKKKKPQCECVTHALEGERRTTRVGSSDTTTMFLVSARAGQAHTVQARRSRHRGLHTNHRGQRETSHQCVRRFHT